MPKNIRLSFVHTWVHNYIQLWHLDYEKPIKTLWYYSLHIVNLVYDSETLLQKKGWEPELYVVLPYTLKNAGLYATQRWVKYRQIQQLGCFDPAVELHF